MYDKLQLDTQRLVRSSVDEINYLKLPSFVVIIYVFIRSVHFCYNLHYHQELLTSYNNETN